MQACYEWEFAGQLPWNFLKQHLCRKQHFPAHDLRRTDRRRKTRRRHLRFVPHAACGQHAGYSAYFTPDDPDAFVLFSGSALTLCAKPSATLEGDTLTVSTSSNYKPDAFVLFVAEYDADGRLLAVHSENITPESGTYTFKVQLGAKIKCFLLRTDTYAPLFGTFSPNA